MPVWLRVGVMAGCLGVYNCGGSPTASSVDNGAVARIDIETDRPLPFSALGEQRQIEVTVRDRNGGVVSDVSVSWEVSDPSVASVDANGLVTSRSNGSTLVSISAGAVREEVGIEVMQIPVAVSLSPEELAFSSIGDTVTVGIDATDSNGFPIEEPYFEWFFTSAGYIASVSSEGLVEARLNGSGTLVARARAGGVSDSIHVSVDTGPIAWTCVEGDYWDVVGCWDQGRLPNIRDTVRIDAEGVYKVIVEDLAEAAWLVVGGIGANPELEIRGTLDLLHTGGATVAADAQLTLRGRAVDGGEIRVEGVLRFIGQRLSNDVVIEPSGTLLMDYGCCRKVLDGNSITVHGALEHQAGGGIDLVDSTILIAEGGVLNVRGSDVSTSPRFSLYNETRLGGTLQIGGGLRFFVTEDPDGWGRIELSPGVEMTFESGASLDVVEERVPTEGEYFDVVSLGTDPFGNSTPLTGQPSNRTSYLMEINPSAGVGLRVTKPGP